VLLAVAARAREPAGAGGAGGVSEPPPRARVRTRSGRWLVLHGLALGTAGAGGSPSAVVVEPALAPEVAPLIVAAYDLSPRERQVAQRVMLGGSTAEIARALSISPYTVQDHLKAIFEKVGVRSRGEMVRRIFERHYLPAGRPGHGPDP
jgi:DNA-binding CsgD family transcriptional regulator